MQGNVDIQLAQRVTGIPLTTRIQEINELATQVAADGTQVAYLTAGEPDFDTPAHIKDAAVAAIKDGYTHYTSNRGLPETRAAVAEKMKRENGLDVDPVSEVLITNGGKHALFIAMMSIIDPGDEVILLEPYFGPFSTITKLAGGKPVPVHQVCEEGRFRPGKDEIENAITDRTKALIFNSPTNPTGTVYRREELSMLGELACKHNLFLIADEVYERITYDDHHHLSVAGLAPIFRQRTIIVNSLSKTYAMTGWRIGYLVAPPEIIDAVSFLNQNSARMASAFVQRAAVEALTGSQQPTVDMVREYDKRRQLIVDGLNSIHGIECIAPEGAFYVFVDVSQFGLSSYEFAKHLVLQGRVATTPGDFFGPGGEGFLRLSFATDANTIERGVAGIRAGVDRLSS